MWVLRKCLKLSDKEINSFSHLLHGLKQGCPPHGGFALGYDRFLSILLHKNSIRDVIAFPKTTQGTELMTGSPSEINNEIKSKYKL